MRVVLFSMLLKSYLLKSKRTQDTHKLDLEVLDIFCAASIFAEKYLPLQLLSILRIYNFTALIIDFINEKGGIK